MASIAAAHNPSTAHDAHHGDHAHHEQGFFRTYIWSHDHKMIAKQYLVTALFFLIVGGLLALGVRWKIAFPEYPVPILNYLLPQGMVVDGVIQPGMYNMLFTMHATVMVFLVVMPLLIGVFGNYLIPLQIGAPDMAFPFYNALSYWLYAISGAIMLYSFFVPGGAAQSGWTSYAPLSTTEAYNGSKLGQSLWGLGIFINGLSSISGAANYITTIVNMRAPGMTMFRMPLTVWSLFITAILLCLAVPVLGAAAAMLYMDLNVGTHFFTSHSGGDPLLWQHLFWFFGHPEVYLVIIPVMGVISHVMATFARKPVFGHRAMVTAMLAIGALGFLIWGHHMFVSGMNPRLGLAFSVLTLVIGVPSAVKTFNWLGTLWGARIRFTTPMLFAIGFVSLFVSGGVTGLVLGQMALDMVFHDTYFVTGHFHMVMGVAAVFGIFAATYYWFPKMFGRMMNETMGKLH
ncbi:MAG: cbb3-type cytochrome c oxidase subunit I, partial [Verrucomicrobia bacterium]|nr:cbb3-type cytochrome c oxidase subunit I [Verrucomicrobiota bacterium]